MNSYGWVLPGEVEIGQYKLSRLVQAARDGAVFEATRMNDGARVLVHVRREETDAPARSYNRFREALFLKHENLLAALDAGTATLQGRAVAYLVTEAADGTALDHVPSGREEVRSFARNCLAALAYLHQQNLNYSILRLESVWRTGNGWKLGDYSQLRLLGSTVSGDTRRLMGQMPEIPPEAYGGVVTEGWDVWSFGVTLARIFREGAPRDGSARPPRVRPPEEFDAIIQKCLATDPAERAPVAELQRSFSEVVEPPPRRPEPPAAFGSDPTFSVPRHSAPLALWTIGGIVAGVALVWFAVNVRHNPAASAPAVTKDPITVDLAKPSPDVPEPKAAQQEDKNQDNNNDADRVATGAEGQIRGLLDRWVLSTRTRNIDEHTSCYAPVVDALYGRHGVTASELRREKQRQFSQISEVKKFNVRDVQVKRMNHGLAVATFKKDWDFGTFAGSEQDQMVMRLVGSEWRISSERPVRTYWTKRSGSPGRNNLR